MPDGIYISVLLISVNADITGKVIPSILLSETKWSFLYQGAIHCFSHVVYNAREIDIYCLNDPVAVSARYIILMDKYAESDLLQLVMSRSVSIWLFTNGGMLSFISVKKQIMINCDFVF